MDSRPIEQSQGDWLARSYVCGYFASTAMLIVLMIAFMGMLLLSGTCSLGSASDRQYSDGSGQELAVHLDHLAFFYGLLLAIGYGAFFHDQVKGPAWQKGLVYSMVPSLFRC